MRTYNIIIVSHSHFLKTIFGIKLNNCQYILEENALSNYQEIMKLHNTMEFKDAKKKFFRENEHKYIFKYPTFKTSSIKDNGGCKDYDKDLNTIQRYIHGFKSKSKTKTKKSKTKTKTKKSKTKKSKTKSKKSKTKSKY